MLLITGELVANASEATPGKKLCYRLERNPKGVLISVWDSSPHVPTVRPVVELTLEALDRSEDAFDSGGGWGLPIVQALSVACGCTPHPTGGKWVWARLVP
ncbi:ATP-binding protein [Thermomonospora catenispora]|uniref:ATP-binding protein n=1 Tax=Thermomonospora catenispora TaxID=2493090 RepID=UPI00111F4A72|nr:ATP-binding protein [Thermomonospora catenispora]TNY35479.1 ATP-binding protein [Thermomonospora catenispora]